MKCYLYLSEKECLDAVTGFVASSLLLTDISVVAESLPLLSTKSAYFEGLLPIANFLRFFASTKDAIVSFQLGSSNTIRFNSVSGLFRLRLSDDTVKTVPYFNKNSKLKKIVPTKHSHELSPYYTLVETSLAEPLLQALEKVFPGEDTVKITTLDQQIKDFITKTTSTSTNTITNTININDINTLPFSVDVVDEEYLADVYEYLCLLHLNSSQLKDDTQFILLSYKTPELGGVQSQLHQFSVQNCSAYCISELFAQLAQTVKFSISAASDSGHLLVFKTKSNMYIWKVQ